MSSEDAPDGLRPTGMPGRAWVLVALAGLLLGAIGFGVGVVIAKPDNRATVVQYPVEGSADAGFARDMSAHHGQAVSMAVEEYSTTTDFTLRTIAIDMALTQQGQIGMMQAWLQTWDLPATTTAKEMAWMPEGTAALGPGGLMPGMATQAEMAKLRAAKGRAKDVLFCQLMIRHHLGGIHMVDGALKLATDPAVRDLARGMKVAQQYEIKAMQDKLKELGAAP